MKTKTDNFVAAALTAMKTGDIDRAVAIAKAMPDEAGEVSVDTAAAMVAAARELIDDTPEGRTCQHRDDGRGRCIDCDEFLDTPEGRIGSYRAATKAKGIAKAKATRAAKKAATPVDAKLAEHKDNGSFVAKPARKPAKPAKAAAATKKPAKAKAAPTGAEKPATVKERIWAMIQRDAGVTEREVCEALGWKKAGATIGRAIKAAPFAVKKERDGSRVRYYAA